MNGYQNFLFVFSLHYRLKKSKYLNYNERNACLVNPTCTYYEEDTKIYTNWHPYISCWAIYFLLNWGNEGNLLLFVKRCSVHILSVKVRNLLSYLHNSKVRTKDSLIPGLMVVLQDLLFEWSTLHVKVLFLLDPGKKKRYRYQDYGRQREFRVITCFSGANNKSSTHFSHTDPDPERPTQEKDVWKGTQEKKRKQVCLGVLWNRYIFKNMSFIPDLHVSTIWKM